MKTQWGPAIRIFGLMTVLSGVIYPLLMTAVSQVIFPSQSQGSFILKDGKVIGSELIAQNFASQKHFWPRPSSVDFNPMPSGGSNLGPTSQDLRSKVEERRKLGLEGDLLFSSGSGLDPHISPESAGFQVPRILESLAKDLKWTNEQSEIARQKIFNLIQANTEDRQYKVFGEPRVNVLKLNLALDREFNVREFH